MEDGELCRYGKGHEKSERKEYLRSGEDREGTEKRKARVYLRVGDCSGLA